jgi:DNA polymerase-1
MIKVAMIRIQQDLKEQKFLSKMTMQVHDELVFDVHHTEVERIRPIIIERMKHAIPMEVPIVVELGQGKNWLEAH